MKKALYVLVITLLAVNFFPACATTQTAPPRAFNIYAIRVEDLDESSVQNELIKFDLKSAAVKAAKGGLVTLKDVRVDRRA